MMDDHSGTDEATPAPIDLPDDVKAEYFALRKLPDERIIGIHRLLYHWTLHIDIDDFGYSERYCYPDLAGAIEGFLDWRGHGDPPGPWVRHPESGRRRNPATGAEWRDGEMEPVVSSPPAAPPPA